MRGDDPFRDHAAEMAKMRRARARLSIAVYLFFAAVIGAAAWTLFHPEAIGSFVGRIARGFAGASR